MFDEAHVRALQALARGPSGTGSAGALEHAERELRAIVPGSELSWVELSPEGRAATLDLGEAVPAGCCAAPEPGAAYLVGGPYGSRALVLRLEEGAAALPRARCDLLRLAAEWLPRWLPVQPPAQPQLPAPVGSGVWIDAAGTLVDADEVARGLLRGAGDLTEALAELYRQRAEGGAESRPVLVLELEGGCIRLQAGYLPESGGPCLVVIERLEPGSRAIFRARTQGLSVREIQVAELVLEGWGNRGVAHKLGLKPATINSYLIQVYKKLGVRNRTELTGFLSGATRPDLAG